MRIFSFYHFTRGVARRELFFFGAALAAIVLLALLSQTSLTLQQDSNSTMKPQAAVTVVFSPEHARHFSGDIQEGITVADVLQIAATTGHFALIMNDQGSPASIDGVESSWKVLQNGHVVTQPLVYAPVSSGDSIEVVASAQ